MHSALRVTAACLALALTTGAMHAEARTATSVFGDAATHATFAAIEQ